MLCFLLYTYLAHCVLLILDYRILDKNPPLQELVIVMSMVDKLVVYL